MRQLGYLGKVPHRGDFVRYNVPSQLHRVWDDWLAETLRLAEVSVEGWPTPYDAAPPWRFALSPDVAGGEARAGVMLSSRDSVGRRYPFALFGALPAGLGPLEALADDRTLDVLERLAREALEREEVYATLKEALGEAQASTDAPAVDPAAVPFRPGAPIGSDEPAVFCEDPESLAERGGLTRLLDAVLRQSTGPYSVWRSRDGPGGPGRLIVTGGLPSGAAAPTLFGAEWSTRAGGRLDGIARTDTLRPRETPPSPTEAKPCVAPGTTAMPPSAVDEPAAVGHAGELAVAAPAPMPAGEDGRPPEPAAPRAPSGREPADAPSADRSEAGPDTDASPVTVEPLEVETLSIEDEDGDAPWDRP